MPRVLALDTSRRSFPADVMIIERAPGRPLSQLNLSAAGRERILVDVGRSASDIYQRLLKEGVIVRPMTPFGMESALRITVGTPQENRRLVKALKSVLGKPTA